jgi:hypothetical protein
MSLGRARLLRAVALLRCGPARSGGAAAAAEAPGAAAAAAAGSSSGLAASGGTRALSSLRATTWDLHYQARVQQITDLALVGQLMPHRRTLAPTFTPHSIMLTPDLPELPEAVEEAEGLWADSVKRKRRAKIKKHKRAKRRRAERFKN